MSPSFSAFDLVQPVLAGTAPTATTRMASTLCGTAFPIGGGVFLTAGHVAREAQTYEVCDLGFMRPPGNPFGAASILEIEIAEEVDLAFLRLERARGFDPQTMLWTLKEQQMLDPVSTFGFPHGLHPETRVLGPRAFQGYVVRHVGEFPRFPARPSVYEVSFHSPRGLSGAPLVQARRNADAAVCGVMLANEIMEMDVYTEKEIEHGETIFVKTEALHLGIALTSDAAAAVNSAMLGGSLGEWLAGYELIAK